MWRMAVDRYIFWRSCGVQRVVLSNLEEVWTLLMYGKETFVETDILSG
jgi:hypothetical protein